jgi:hypothetical protein
MALHAVSKHVSRDEMKREKGFQCVKFCGMTPSDTLVVLVMAAVTVVEMDHGKISAGERMEPLRGMNEEA